MKRFILALLLFAVPAWGQTSLNGRVQTGVSTLKPSSCNPADQFNAIDNFHIYVCGPVNVWVDDTGGGGGGGTPGAPAGTLQWNNGGVFGSVGLTDGSNIRSKGPDPVTDIMTFGARALSSGFSTTASCNGTTSITLAAASSFQNGDGITVYGCGATNTLSTPTAPSAVTPSVASGGTATGIVTNSATGGTTYSYKIVARDKFGALTAASPATTIATGQATLGLTTATITTETLASDVITFNTSAATLIVVGTLIHVTGASNPNFDGWYIVSTMPTSQQGTIVHAPIDSRGLGWNFGDSASSSGGTIAYYLSNHVTWAAVANAWEYYIYMQAGGAGAYNLIGQTTPSADSWVETQFDDYGATFMAGQTFPAYVPSTAPSSATNDPLTTTILSGAGTTSIVVANTASQTIAGQTALFDDGPALLAAANAAISAGPVYVPPVPNGQAFFINSYTSLPQHVRIHQAGTLTLNETLNLVDVTWDGNFVQSGTPQFAYSGPAYVSILAANPGIYESGGSGLVEYVTFATSGTNGGTLWISKDEYNGVWRYVNFESNLAANGDYLGKDMILRSTSSGGNPNHFDHVTFNGGPNQITDKSWTPLVYFPPNQNGSGGLLGNQSYFMYCETCFFNRRGVEEDMAGGTSGRWEFHNSYRQGGITPFMAVSNSSGSASGSFIFDFNTQDTEATGTLALWGSFSASVDAHFLSNASSDTNGAPPPFSGYRTNSVTSFGSLTGTLPHWGTEMTTVPACAVVYPFDITGTNQCSTHSIRNFLEPVDFPNGTEIFWPLPAPTGVTAAAAIAGGTLSAGTYFYTVSATGIDGGETVPATIASSSTTSGGNLTIPLSWTGVPGAVTYNVYRCSTTCVFSDGRITNAGGWRQIARLVNGTILSDTGLGQGQSPPTQTGTGSTIINGNQVYSPLVQSPSMVSGKAGSTPPSTVCGTATGVICFGSATNPCVPTAGQACIRFDKTTDRFVYTLDGSAEAALVGSSGAPIDLVGQTAAISATNMNNSVPTTAMYRLCFSADITTVAGTSSTLGGANGFQVIYTSPTDSVVKTTVPNAAWSSTANTTATAVGGCQEVYAKAATPLQFTFGYASNAANIMTYEFHVREEDGN